MPGDPTYQITSSNSSGGNHVCTHVLPANVKISLCDDDGTLTLYEEFNLKPQFSDRHALLYML